MSFFNGDMKTSELNLSGGINLGSDASGDMYYRNASGNLTRIGVGDDNDVLTLNGVVPGWEAASGGGGEASTSSANSFTAVQTITSDTDGEFVALKLINQSDAANTTGIVSLEFDLEDTGGTAVDAGKIAVKKNVSFTSTASTQDSNMVFSTSLNGTLTEYLTLDSNGKIYSSSGDKTHASVGSGFNHTNSICNFYINKIGGEIITTFLIDLTDLTYSSSPDSTSVIGKASTSASYFYETATATNGVIYNIELVCLEAPAGASSPATSIGIHYNTSSLSTGDAVSSQKIIMNSTQSIGTKSELAFGESIASGATKLYLFGNGGSTSTYSGGQFLVKLYGAPTL